MIAFWLAMTNHCDWEIVSAWKFLACSPESTPHQPSDCGETDACATVEDGLFKTEENQISPGKPTITVVNQIFPAPDTSTPAQDTRQVSPETIPPELAHRWQFSFRTALSPRAPTLLS